MKIKKSGIFLMILLLAAFLVLNSMFTVRENEYACTVRFAKIIDTTGEAGLHFKIPFVDSVKYFPKATQLYDIPPSEVLTSDKQNMTVHRWFANKSCPGKYLYDRHPAIAAEVNKRLGQDTKEEVKVMYRVQIGAYSKKENAEKCLEKAKAAGFTDAFIKAETVPTAEKTETPKEPEVVLAVGDKVKMAANAPVYGKTTKFSSWVYETLLYVREIKGSRVVVSTRKTGAVTGAVDKKYLTKV